MRALTAGYSVVWFKRDLRLHDHAALHQAARQGPVLCLYVIEPRLWAAPDAARQHYQFVLESLHALAAALAQQGGKLCIATGEVTHIFDRLFTQAPFAALFSHEETGNDLTYRRDRAVDSWCRARGVAWHEFAQIGVIRRLQSRAHWLSNWESHVRAHVAPLPRLHGVALPWVEPPPPSATSLGLASDDPPQRQRGGREIGLSVLEDFLSRRSGHYHGGISSPLSAPTACSRLSPYLASGCLSLREVVQATRAHMTTLGGEDRRKRGLAQFVSRLHWHCHFIQKLESEPALEFRNLHRGYDGLREGEHTPSHFDALVEGRTGWPLVDASVAMLRETGWLNFRMRAMLVSVAAYPLWLHWRPVGLWLARQFLDYEPGIHWCQMQMQSGTTGINAMRVYNPIKQARDHDPRGVFVRRWLPAMRRVPDAWLFEPWRMPADLQARCGVVVGVDIARPPVEMETAMRSAKARLHALRAQPEVRTACAAIVDRHGSRRRGTTARRPPASDNTQLMLDF